MEEKQETENIPENSSRFVEITHDSFFREIFRDPDIARPFLKKTLKPEAVKVLNFENMEILSNDFLTSDGHEQRADTIYRIPHKQEKREAYFYTILEHKAKNDHWVVFQVTQYVFELERKLAGKPEERSSDFLIPMIVPIVVVHGERPYNGPKQSSDLHEPVPGYEESCLRVDVIWEDLIATPDEELPSDPDEPRLHMAMLMMKYIKHKNFKKKFLEIMIKLQPYLSISKYREFRSLILHYAVSRARYFTREDLQEILKQVPNPTQEKEEMSLMEQLKTEGRAEGRVEGKVEGRVEGRVEGKVELILLFLSSLGHVPQEIVERIQKTDSSRLNDLALLAKNCDSIEEFEKAL